MSKSSSFDLAQMTREIDDLKHKLIECNLVEIENDRLKQDLQNRDDIIDFIWKNVRYEISESSQIEFKDAFGEVFLGNRYWINAEIGSPGPLVTKIVEFELEKRRYDKVYKDSEERPVEILIFYVYTKISVRTGKEKVAPDDIPDYKFSWRSGGELILEHE
ncbi:MAG TPA: hypothetical protein ENN73_01260 [Firmicutes bacterium]|nr:hypothetical protein [Bacillota bacterium]